MDKKNTAILWDIENVTPPSGTNYIQSIIDKISETGSISYAMAFGDWNTEDRGLFRQTEHRQQGT